MQISVDISMYPLQKNFEKPILKFIGNLDKIDNINVVRNELNTQIYGDYKIIMSLLEKQIYEVFNEIPHTIFAIKIIGNNRKGKYEVKL